jgi:phosphoserine phosphatase
MRGAVPLEEVYARRLDLVRPSRARLEALGGEYVAAMVPHARETVAALRAEGIDVRVLSGGLRPAVLVLARALGLPDHAVAAVDVYFDAAGAYAGFDTTSPLARAGGKAEVIAAWRPAPPRPSMLVGDGATDLEAYHAVDCFVAFAGVAERAAVMAGADAVIGAPSLAPVLPLARGAVPPRARAAHRDAAASVPPPASHPASRRTR